MKKAIAAILLIIIIILTGCGNRGDHINEDQELPAGQDSQAQPEATGTDVSASDVEITSEAESIPEKPEPFVDKLTPEALGWGLSFGESGTQPAGNASPEELKQYDAYFMGDADENVIYLTFDCGYENGYTEQILDALKKHQAPAAFFVVGNMIETAPDIIRRMAEEGHIVGNHTFHHPDMSRISDQASFKKELDDLAALYKETTGRDLPAYYRPPQGKYSEENLRQAQALGYKTVFWSLAYVDWYVDNQPTAEQAYAKLLPRIHDGAIVLLHSTSRTNAEILDDLLTKWEDMGYTFASLDQLPSCGGA